MEITVLIEQAIVNLGGFGVFIGSVLEEIIVPIPSSFVQAGAGLVLLSGQTFDADFLFALVSKIAVPSALGVLVGSLPLYFISFYGGEYAVRKFGKFFFLKYEQVESARTRLTASKYSGGFLVLLRLLPLLPSAVVTVACGFLRVPFRTYALTTLIGVFIRAMYLGTLGWLTGKAGGEKLGADNLLEKVGLLVLVLVVISVITTLFINRSKKTKSIAQNENQKDSQVV